MQYLPPEIVILPIIHSNLSLILESCYKLDAPLKLQSMLCNLNSPFRRFRVQVKRLQSMFGEMVCLSSTKMLCGNFWLILTHCPFCKLFNWTNNSIYLGAIANCCNKYWQRTFCFQQILTFTSFSITRTRLYTCLSWDQFDDIRGWIMTPIHQMCPEFSTRDLFLNPHSLKIKPIYFSMFQGRCKRWPECPETPSLS